MNWTLVFADPYNRGAARLLKRHADLQPTYRKTLELLAPNPHHPSLRLHARRGSLGDCTRSRSTCRTASR